MNIRCVEPPQREPISLKELKEYLRIEGDLEHGLLENLIQAARWGIEEWTGRVFIRRTLEATLHWDGISPIDLPYPPFVTLVEVRDSVGNTLKVKDILRGELKCQIVLQPRQPGEVKIHYQAGYGVNPEEVPAPLRLAILTMAGKYYEARGSDVGGIDQNVIHLIYPYQIRRLP